MEAELVVSCSSWVICELIRRACNRILNLQEGFLRIFKDLFCILLLWLKKRKKRVFAQSFSILYLKYIWTWNVITQLLLFSASYASMMWNGHFTTSQRGSTGLVEAIQYIEWHVWSHLNHLYSHPDSHHDCIPACCHVIGWYFCKTSSTFPAVEFSASQSSRTH